MASTSFLTTFSPKTTTSNVVYLSKPPQTSFSSQPITFSPLNSLSFPSFKRYESLSCRFVPNVAVSSEYGQQEDGLVSEEEEGVEFSPELKLFVGNLPFNVDSSELAGLFGSAGNVEMVEVIYDKVTGRSRGFGFVTMSTVEEVEAAAQQFNGYELEGRPLRVNAGPPPKRDDSAPRGGRGGSSYDNPNRLHVGNLSWKVDDAALKTLFSELGDVLEAKVIYDRDSGRSRGFGFVTYSSSDEVNNAIESLDGVDLNGRSIRVTVAESRPRRRF